MLLRKSFTARCTYIWDGDTIKVHRRLGDTVIRVAGIDCPEKGQRYGGKATTYARRFCLGKRVRITVTGKDNYGRTVAKVKRFNKSLSKELLKRGLAWKYRPDSRDAGDFTEAEGRARRKKRGLWRQKNPVTPWSYRASERAVGRVFGVAVFLAALFLAAAIHYGAL